MPETPKIEKFTRNYASIESRRNLYFQIKSFLEFTYDCITVKDEKGKIIKNKHTEEDIENLANKYLSEKRNYEEDIERYAQYLQNRPPLSQKIYLSTIKIFLEYYDIELPKKFWKYDILKKITGDEAVSFEDVPTPKDLKMILAHSDIRLKALVLLMSSSGMRVGELLKLTWDDIDLNKRIVYVISRNAKKIKKNIHFLLKNAKMY